MSIEINTQRDQELMRLLGITQVGYLIAHTDKGELTLTLHLGEEQYRFALNGVPVADELNYKLMNFYV